MFLNNYATFKPLGMVFTSLISVHVPRTYYVCMPKLEAAANGFLMLCLTNSSSLLIVHTQYVLTITVKITHAFIIDAFIITRLLFNQEQ